jgi:ABC-type cobalt transport system substrate-binding protein
MFDVGFIVLRKVVLYICREIEGGSWAGGEGEAEEVIRVYSRHSRRKGCRKSYGAK